MHNLAIKGLDTLKAEIPSILGPKLNHKTLKLIVVKYYEYSQRYCISEKDHELLKNKFNQVVLEEYNGIADTKYDIDILVSEMYPLGIPEYKRKPQKQKKKKTKKQENIASDHL